MFLYDFGEPYKSVQQMYENAIRCTLFSTVWCTSVSGQRVVHLLYKDLQDLPLWYRLYTNSVSALCGCYFGEPYQSVQEVYKNAFCCRLVAMAW